MYKEVSFIIISNMGGNQSMLPTPNFREQEWESAPVSCYTRLKDPYYGSNFKVLLNRLNRSMQVEQYDLTFTTDPDYQAYCAHLNWRNSNNYLVAPKFVQHLHGNALCSSFQYASIYFERTPVRLYEIQDISLEEGLYILYATIQGFERLFQQFGYFDIQSDLICFSRQGFVRVWANRNLSKATPEYPNTHPAQPYSSFFSKLLNIVEKLIDFQGKPTITSFIQRKRIKQPLHNLLGVLELYIKEAKMIIPRYLASIRNLCSSSRKSRSRGNPNNSLVFSNNGCSNNSHQKNVEETNSQPPNNQSPFSSFNTPYRRSHELNPNDNHPRKRFSFIQTNPVQKPSPPPISFQSASPDSPKNFSYSTQEDVFLKSKIYSGIDIFQQNLRKKEGMRQVSSYLETDNLDIDPEIAADMLRMAQRSS